MKKLNPGAFFECFFDCAVFIVFFIFLIWLFSQIGFLFRLSLNCFYVPLSFIPVSLYFIKKKTNYNKAFLVLFLLVSGLVSWFLSVLFYDSSCDGKLYHIQTVILLKEGWNPVINTFDINKSDFSNTLLRFNMTWEQYYPKFCETVSANFALIFKYFEAGKILNGLFCFELFFLCVFSLSKLKNLSPLFNFLLSLLICLNPVMIAQFTSFYGDMIFYVLFCNLIFCLFLKNKFDESNQTLLDCFFAVNLVMISCIKMSGLVYFIAFLAAYYLLGKLNYLKNKAQNFANILLFSSLIMLVVSINPYFTNIFSGHGAFYPLDSDEVVKKEWISTKQYLGKSWFYRTFYAVFGVPEGGFHSFTTKYDTKIVLKNPFTVGQHRIDFTAGTFYCGFGYFWGGILILYFLYLIFNLKTCRDEKYLLLVLFCSVLFTPYNAWARFIPQFWLLPVLSVGLFLNEKDISKIKKTFLCFFIAYMFLNCAIVLKSNLTTVVDYKTKMNKIFNSEGKNLYVYLTAFRYYPRTINHYFSTKSEIFEQMKERKVEYKFVTADFFEKNKDKFSPVPDTIGYTKIYWLRTDEDTDEIISFDNDRLKYKGKEIILPVEEEFYMKSLFDKEIEEIKKLK